MVFPAAIFFDVEIARLPLFRPFFRSDYSAHRLGFLHEIVGVDLLFSLYECAHSLTFQKSVPTEMNQMGLMKPMVVAESVAATSALATSE